MKTSVLCILLATVLMLFADLSFSQVAINNDGSAPDNSAMLDVKATDRGLLIPRISNAGRNQIPSPANGLLIFNTSTDQFNYYNSGFWCQLISTFVSSTTGTLDLGGGISIDISSNSTPVNSAILGINNQSRGILIPRTSPNYISSPATGLIIYNTTTNLFNYYNGIQWMALSAISTGFSGTGGSQASIGVAIKTDDSNPDPSAVLDVSAIDKGVLIPRLTTIQRDSILPAPGLIIYNLSSNNIEFYTGSSWNKIISNKVAYQSGSPQSPVMSSPNAFDTPENQTIVGTISAGAGCSYSIVGGVDSSFFLLDTNTGILTLNTASFGASGFVVDYENPLDAYSDNVYEVTVRATNTTNGLFTDENITAIVVDDGYLVESEALFRRMTIQPEFGKKMLINNTISELKNAGLWDKLDALWVCHASNEQAAKLNWIKDANNLTKGGAGTLSFTEDAGFTSDGTTYLNTNYNPTIHGIKFTLNNAGFGIKTSGNIGSNSAHGYYNSASTGVLIGKYGTAGIGRINSVTPINLVETIGYNYMGRSSGINANCIKNYEATLPESNLSNSIPNGNLYLLGCNNGSAATFISTETLELAWIGEAMTNHEYFMFVAIMEKYLSPARTFDKGKVLFEFDENYDNLINLGLPAFASRGKVADVGYITTTGNLSWANVKTLIAAGWEIKDHTYTHPNFGTITPAQRTEQILQTNAAFEAQGLADPVHYTFPSAILDQANINAISTYRLTSMGFEISRNFNPNYSNVDKYRLSFAQIDNGNTTTARAKEIIDECAAGKFAVIFVSHSIRNNTGASAGIDISKLIEILDYAISKNVDIINSNTLYPLLN